MVLDKLALLQSEIIRWRKLEEEEEDTGDKFTLYFNAEKAV